MSDRMCPIARHAAASPERIALEFEARRWTYAELDAHVAAWAEWLSSRDVERGDRVAVSAWNHPDVVALFHAAARVGAVWVPLNARLTASEADAHLSGLRPRLVLAQAPLMSKVPGAMVLPALDATAASSAPAPELPPADAVRAILFTSGTSGTPRGAELTFANFDASARASAANLGGDQNQSWLGTLPLFHIGGLAMAHRCATYGARLVLHERFDASATARAVQTDGITHLSVVGTTLQWLLEEVPPRATANLRVVLVGGGPVAPALLQRARSCGWPVLQTYGLTEACSQVTTESPTRADGETAGGPLEGLRVRIAAEDGAEVPVGEAGEIQVRGPTVMKGYFEDPASTQATRAGEWLRTGDVGSVDARGRLTVHARRTDLIVSGGENIYPAELERVLTEHPHVFEAAVVAVPDARWGQVPTALVVPRPSSAGGSEWVGALEAFCRQRLAGFKVPREFIAVATLPRTGSGKVDRSRLAALARGFSKEVGEQT